VLSASAYDFVESISQENAIPTPTDTAVADATTTIVPPRKTIQVKVNDILS